MVDSFGKADTMSTMAATRSRRPHRRFTDEFKQQAVRLVVDEGNGVLREAEPMEFAFIAAKKAKHTVTILCRCARDPQWVLRVVRARALRTGAA